MSSDLPSVHVLGETGLLDMPTVCHVFFLNIVHSYTTSLVRQGYVGLTSLIRLLEYANALSQEVLENELH